MVTTSVIIHILHNYDNILKALEGQLSKVENTMEQLIMIDQEVPDDILIFYNRISDARSSLRDSYISLASIKEIA